MSLRAPLAFSTYNTETDCVREGEPTRKRFREIHRQALPERRELLLRPRNA